MKEPRTRSLQWVLVRRLILLQAATLAIFIVLCAAALWISNPHWLVDNEAAVAALKGAVERSDDGGLVVRETEELRQFRERFPHLGTSSATATAKPFVPAPFPMSMPRPQAIC